MNRSILTALCALTMGLFPVAGLSQLYIATSAAGSQTESWLDVSGERDSAGDPYFHVTKDNVIAAYRDAYLTEPAHRTYNIEWLDGRYTLTYPPSCVFVQPTGGAYSQEYLRNNGSNVAKAQSDAVTSGTLNGVILKHHLEPVNRTGNSTGVGIYLPGTIECSSGLGEFTATVTGFSNAQKWWDGGTPNWRRTTQTMSVTYKPLDTISAEFSPQTISMTGTVGTYIENRTDLIVTTSGGTKVVIEWPEVNTVEYGQAGEWVTGHTQSVSVTDGANKINKRIRVRSSEAGSTTISVPVTMTLN